MSFKREEREKQEKVFQTTFKHQIAEQETNRKVIEELNAERVKLENMISGLNKQILSAQTELDDTKKYIIKQEKGLQSKIGKLTEDRDAHEASKVVFAGALTNFEEYKINEHKKIDEERKKVDDIKIELNSKMDNVNSRILELAKAETELSHKLDDVEKIKSGLNVKSIETEKLKNDTIKLNKDSEQERTDYLEAGRKLAEKSKELDKSYYDIKKREENLKKYEQELQDKDIELEARRVETEKLLNKTRNLIAVHKLDKENAENSNR